MAPSLSLLLATLFGTTLVGFSQGFVVMQKSPSGRAFHHDDNVKKQTGRCSMALKESLQDYSHVKGVIFDIDGTLCDSWKLGFDATQVVLEKNGIDPINEEEYHFGCRYATPERLARHAGVMPDHDSFEEVGTRLGKEFDDFYVGLVNLETAGFYDGMHDILQNLPSDVSVGALTNACVKYAHAVLETNSCSEGKVYKMFGTAIRGADNVPQPKPAPDGLHVICKDMGLSPKECVYVGDSPSDGMAAEAAGMPAIGVLWGSNSREKMETAPFSHLCSTVQELEQLLPQNAAVAAGKSKSKN